MHESEINGITLNPPTDQVNRENDCDYKYLQYTLHPVVTGATTSEQLGTIDISVIRGNSDDKSRGTPRTVYQNKSTEGEPQVPDIVIETDASMLGWGAACSGVRTGGLWSQTERKNHINFLELLGATFAVKAFAKDTWNYHTYLIKDGQQHCSKSDRRNSLHSTEQLSDPSL